MFSCSMDLFHSQVAFPLHILPIGTSYYYGLDPLIGTVNYGQTISRINSAERFLVFFFLGSGSLNTTKKGTSELRSFVGLSAMHPKILWIKLSLPSSSMYVQSVLHSPLTYFQIWILLHGTPYRYLPAIFKFFRLCILIINTSSSHYWLSWEIR